MASARIHAGKRAAWLAVLLWGAGALGAVERAAAADEDAEQAARALLVTKLAQPPLTSPIDGPNAQFTLQGTSTDRTATARVAYQLDDSALGDLLLDLKLSGPLASSEETRLADLDGLRNSTTLDFGVAWIRWDPRADPAQQTAICEEYKRTLDPEHAEKFTCTLLGLPRDSDYRRRFERAVDWGTPLILKLRYRIGRRDFHYVDPATLTSGEVSHTNYSISAAAGVVLDALGLVAVAYRYEEAFRVAEQTELCTPLGSTGALTCDPAQIGPPTRRQAHVLQAEIRKYFGERLGVNPRASYELQDEVLGLELPLYFLHHPEGGLNGGVSLGWRSDDDTLLLSVFVGVALGLIL